MAWLAVELGIMLGFGFRAALNYAGEAGNGYRAALRQLRQ